MICKPPDKHFSGPAGRTIPVFNWGQLRDLCGFPQIPPAIPDWENRKTSVTSADAPVLIALAGAQQPKTVLELGVSEGHLSRHLLARCASIRFYLGVDVPDAHTDTSGFVGNAFDRGHFAMSDGRFGVLVGAGGIEAIPENIWDQFWDFIFIDADHSYEAVRHDTQVVQRWVKPGGLLVWHDYYNLCHGVYRYLNERCLAGHDIMAAATVAWEIVK